MREKKDNKNSNGNGRMLWKPGNMVYPVPAVMVTAADREGKSNIITIAWTGTVCTNPPWHILPYGRSGIPMGC